jgi:quercetin dioxygenase-like cupin family protein
MAKCKRYVVGPDVNGQSAVLMHDSTNVQENPGFFYRATLWSTKEVPVDNTLTTDRALECHTREPPRGGMLYRALEIFPDPPDRQAHIAAVTQLHRQVGQRHEPTAQDLARHPSMHRTDTLDCFTCVRGEIYLMTDVDEVLLRPGDTVIIRGTNHAWSNRSTEPCLLVGCMIDANR